jgi:hypothetical protein
MTYWLRAGDVPSGPFTVEQIHQKLAAGEVAWTTSTCRVGGSEWLPLVKTPGIGPDSQSGPAVDSSTQQQSPDTETIATAAPSDSVSNVPPVPAASGVKADDKPIEDDDAKGLAGPVFGWLMIGAIVFLGVSCGLLPTSCASKVPLLKNMYKDTCHECNGTGATSGNYSRCQGRGYYAGANCSTCGGSGKSQGTCRFCNGSGRKPK